MTNEEIAGAGAVRAADQVEAAPAVTDAPAEPEQSAEDAAAAPTEPEKYSAEWYLARLAAAKEAEAAAKAVEIERQAAVQAVQGSIREAREEIERLQALDELTAEQQLAQENARRRVRRLNEDLGVARAASQEATAATTATWKNRSDLEHEMEVSKLSELDDDYVADVKATAERLREKRKAIWKQMHEVHEVGPNWDRPFNPRGFKHVLAGCTNPNDSEFLAAQETFTRLVAMNRAELDAQQNVGVYIADRVKFAPGSRDGKGDLIGGSNPEVKRALASARPHGGR